MLKYNQRQQSLISIATILLVVQCCVEYCHSHELSLEHDHRHVHNQDYSVLQSLNSVVHPIEHERHSSKRTTERKIQQSMSATNYYYETTSLGYTNTDVTIGNPMKGLLGNGKNDVSQWPVELPASLEEYKLSLNEIMIDNPDVVGASKAYNWTSFDNILKKCSQNSRHAIVRFLIHWPGEPLYIPSYLLKGQYKVEMIRNRNELIPYWGDPKLLKAIQQFLSEFGKKYDGDRRIFVIQAGLIGAWGEHHAQGCEYGPDDGPCDPEWVYEKLVDYYDSAFQETKVQFRYPNLQKAYNAKFGFHDDSYTKFTVSGVPNGGVVKNSAFWNMAERNNISSFWKWNIMGGEIHPENGDCFSNSYPDGTEYHQDFNICTRTTHATYMSWNRGFRNGGVGNGNEQNNAKYAAAHMGYNYKVTKVGIVQTSSTIVTIDVTIEQIGVAPFYYDLFLNVFCDNNVKKASKSIPTSSLIHNGNSTTISLTGIHASPSCFQSIELQLGSTYTYTNRTIKWAQNNNGRIILNNVPLPPNSNIVPQLQPIPVSMPSPAQAPVTVPVPMLVVPRPRQRRRPRPMIFSVPVPFPVPQPVPVPQPLPVVTSVPTTLMSVRPIKECYIVCAGKQCRSNTRSNSDTHQFFWSDDETRAATGSTLKVPVDSQRRRISQSVIGTEISIVCDVSRNDNDNDNDNEIDKVIFEWPVNEKKIEGSAPYSMGGNLDSNLLPIKYLSTTGDKTIIVSVYNKDDMQIDYLKIVFRIGK